MAENSDIRGWQVGKSLKETNQYMLDNQIGCDVNFKVHSPDGSTIKIPAHKYMLVSRSPVFQAMLCGPGEYKETGGDVVITDVESDVFREMLRFMYTEEVSITAHNVLYLMTAGKKYILDPLVARCTKFLEDNMSIDNVCTILNHCVLQDEQLVMTKCMDFIAPAAATILKSESFLEVSQPVLVKILETDQLEIGNEIEVFNACKTWAQHKCEIECYAPEHADQVRKVLGDALFQVRFPSIDPDDFMTEVGLSCLLTDEELKILGMCCVPKKEIKEATDAARKLGFSMSKRYSCVLYYCNRFTRVGGQWSVGGESPDVISFKVNKQIMVKGIGVYGGKKLGDRHTYEVKVYDANQEQWIHMISGSLTSDGSSRPVHVMFKNTIKLCKDMFHAVWILLKGPYMFRGKFGISACTVTEQCVTFSFQPHDDSKNNTSVTTGQIPEILFTVA